MSNKKRFTAVILIVVMVVYIGIKTYTEKAAAKKVDKAIGTVAGFADVDYGNISIDLLRSNAHIKGVTILPAGEDKKIIIDDIIIYDIDGEDKIPSYLHICFNGIDINIDSFGDSAKELRSLGYDDIKANIELDYKYNDKKKEFNLNSLIISAKKMGNINLDFHMSNIDLNPDNILSVLFRFPQILIHNAELIYKDDSLVARLQQKAAKENSEDLGNYISRITREIDNKTLQEQDKFARQSMEAVKKFIKKPNNISISISPDKPVPIGRIQKVNDPKEIIKLLNVKISI